MVPSLIVPKMAQKYGPVTNCTQNGTNRNVGQNGNYPENRFLVKNSNFE